jgi:hypothetical protein
MLSPLETGTIRGQPRDAGSTGKLVILAGAWHWRAARGAGKARRLADLVWRAKRKAPSISYMEGALSHCAWHRGLCHGDTPANANGRREPQAQALTWACQRRPSSAARAASQSPRAAQTPGRPSPWNRSTSSATGA